MGPTGSATSRRSSSPGSCTTRPRSPPSPTSGSTPTSASCPGAEAPVGVEWARYDAAALVRVPSVKPGRIDSTRIEYRSPDPAANPYLAFAVILAAGLRGVRGDYELPAEGERTAPSAPVARAKRSTSWRRSTLLHETLGEHQVEWFLRNKRAEWDAYRGQVTPFELERYLPLL